MVCSIPFILLYYVVNLLVSFIGHIYCRELCAFRYSGLVEKFYYHGSSLNFSFLHRGHDINYKYEVDVCVNGNGMDRIIIMGDCLLVMAGGARLSGMGRKDLRLLKVKLPMCFNKHPAMKKHGRSDTFSCTQSWM